MPGKQKTEKIIFTNGVGLFTTFQNLKFTTFMNNVSKDGVELALLICLLEFILCFDQRLSFRVFFLRMMVCISLIEFWFFNHPHFMILYKLEFLEFTANLCLKNS